jgi:hypothetical protein
MAHPDATTAPIKRSRKKIEYDYKADCKVLSAKNEMLDAQLRNAIKNNQDLQIAANRLADQVLKLQDANALIQDMLQNVVAVSKLGGK